MSSTNLQVTPGEVFEHAIKLPETLEKPKVATFICGSVIAAAEVTGRKIKISLNEHETTALGSKPNGQGFTVYVAADGRSCQVARGILMPTEPPTSGMPSNYVPNKYEKASF